MNGKGFYVSCGRAVLIGEELATAAVSLAAYRWHQRRVRSSAPMQPEDEPNCLLHLPSLRHTHLMVRHGESTANVAQMISSDPAISTVTHGLTAHGREQVAAEVAQWSRGLPIGQLVVVLSSNFERARETAEIFHSHLRVCHALQLHLELRERCFGEWNGSSTSSYNRI